MQTVTRAVNLLLTLAILLLLTRNAQAQAPTITSFTPTSGPVGTVVLITGTNFSNATAVKIGDLSIPFTPSSENPDTQITATIAAGAVTDPLHVVTPNGKVTSASDFTVTTGSTGGGLGHTVPPAHGPGGGVSKAPPGSIGHLPAPATTYALTVVNGTGSGMYPASAVVSISANAAPTGEAFLDWTDAIVQNPNAISTTLVMPAANTTVAPNYAPLTPGPVPFPVTGHPRLWITAADLPRLQSWATSSNPIYAQGMAVVLNQAVSVYNNNFFPGGVPNPNYPDPGDTQGYVGNLTEEYGVILAFNSLIDPNPSNRILYAQYARNLLMVAMNQAALGQLSGAPFRDPLFAVYNRANGSGEEWPLIVDWIYNAVDGQGQPILTASDKATIRNVFLMWADSCLNAETTGGDHPSPPGVVNSLELLPGNLPYRYASNNYFLGHARLLTMMALSMDPTDDPPVNASLPVYQIGNSIRSFITDGIGAWLYQLYAMMGEPSAVTTSYGITSGSAGFGLANGGLPPEGMLYGHSFAYILGQLLALQTAGFNNVTLSGPQIQMIGAPVWDRYVTGLISSFTPTPMIPPSETYLGEVYQFASYGDLLRLYATPDFMQPFALLTLLDAENGVTTHANASRWFAVNAVEGGAAELMYNVSVPWTWSSIQSILYYMLLDPTAAPGTDPRPTFPTLFYDPGAGRIVAHSDWSATNTMFSYRASWESINHQDGNAGQFELYRNGEWLTKEMSNYDNNLVGFTAVYHNTLGLQNACMDGVPASLQWFEVGEWANGGQWILGSNAGDPTTVMSSGAGYVYAATNMTNLYNRPDFYSPNDAADNITQATRSILWLNNDYIVTYDRATSQSAGLFKNYNLCLVNSPVISGNVSTETMADGQKLFIQTLLPLNPSISAYYAAGNLNPIAELEPTQYILTVADPTLPTDTRFLHVLQGANPGVAMAKATYLQSGGGVAFDGAAFGGMAIYFPVSASGTFATTTFSAPASAQTLMVTGLAANASYGVNIQSGANGFVITVTPGGASATADAAGVLTVSL